MKTISLFAVSLLFYFSGIAALTYEVLWVRHLGLIFGNTVYAAATVMMTYMFGLAIGAHYAGRLANKIRNPLKIFGFLELATALYALCIPFIFDLIQYSYKFVSLNKFKYINQNTFFYKYIITIWAGLLLWKYYIFGKKISYINFLPAWNFILILILPPGTILGPVTGSHNRSK